MLIIKILNDSSLNITDLRPEMPLALAAIVHRAMEKDTSRRYRQWSDLTADLAACVGDDQHQGFREIQHAQGSGVLCRFR